MIKGNQQTHIKSIDEWSKKRSFVNYNSRKNVKGIRLKVNTFFFTLKHTSGKNIIRFSSFKNGVNYGKCTVQLKSECL